MKLTLLGGVVVVCCLCVDLAKQLISKLVRRKFPKILRLVEPTAQFYEVLP